MPSSASSSAVGAGNIRSLDPAQRDNGNGIRTLSLADLRHETVTRNLHCGSQHPRMFHITCDLLDGHQGDHERVLLGGDVLAWPLTQREEQQQVFDWAAGINSNPYKGRTTHRVTPCVTDEDVALRARKIEDRRKGILPILD